VLGECESADYYAELEGSGMGEGWESERALGFEELRDRL